MSVPVPACCAARPTVGGVVVPHVSVMTGGRPVLGAVHKRKALECIRDRCCQICGTRIVGLVVVIVDAVGLDRRYTGEAPLDPVCAAYSGRVCPALSGAVSTLRSVDGHLGRSCDVPGCDCAGWVDSDPAETPPARGAALGPWLAVWLDRYNLVIDEQRRLRGLGWTGIEPRRVRPIPVTADHQVRRPVTDP